MFNHLETPRSKKKKKKKKKTVFAYKTFKTMNRFCSKLGLYWINYHTFFIAYLMIRLISPLICLLVLRNKKLIRFGRFAVKWRSFECRGGKK